MHVNGQKLKMTFYEFHRKKFTSNVLFHDGRIFNDLMRLPELQFKRSTLCTKD